MRAPEIAPIPATVPFWLRLLGLVVVAGLAVFAIDRWRAPPAPPPVAVQHGYGPRSYAAAIAAADDGVALGRDRVARAPHEWLNQELLARALLRRARLNASFDDLAAANAAVAQGLADAPAGAGPVLTGAIAALAVHRLAPVEALLRRFDAAVVPNDAGDRAEAAALYGDLAFYSGRYADAGAAYARSARLENGGGAAVRQAMLARARGDLAAADAALRRAVGPAPGRQGHATLLLQRGGVALAGGRWADAAALFAKAEAVFPGWWLVAAHRAQMLAANGDLAAADRAYRAIIGRTAHADPVVIDALAALCFERGDLAEGRVWAAQSGAIWEQRLLILPEASYGHAAEHELAVGDPVRALDLARKNVAARPYGDAQLLLATAQLANGDAEAAVATVEALNVSGWRSAAQYAVLADALALLERGEEADAARAAALAINPHGLDAATSLLWFGAH